MTTWTIWLAALAVGAATLTWGLNREFARLEREAAYRRWLATSPKFRELSSAFTAFKVAIGVAMLPAVRDIVRAAADAEEQMRRLNATIRGER